jgi:hypothetical protein
VDFESIQDRSFSLIKVTELHYCYQMMNQNLVFSFDQFSELSLEDFITLDSTNNLIAVCLARAYSFVDFACLAFVPETHY